MKKISVIGAGRVGETTAQFLAMAELCNEIALVDIKPEFAQGAALDINQAGPIFGYDTKVIGGDISIIDGSEIVIVTAGLPRKPGMTRSDLLEVNVKIADGIIDEVMKRAPESILLFVSNPVDVITYYAWKKTGWDRSRVFGQAGALDSSRMAHFISEAVDGLSIRNIKPLVLGGHGDTMVPMPRHSEILTDNGTTSMDDMFTEEVAADIIAKTQTGGADVLALRGNSSAFQAPAAAVVSMVESIVHNKNFVVPTVVCVEGEYGLDDMAIGLPATLNSNGMDNIHVLLDMTLDETAKLNHSASLIADDINILREKFDI